MFKHTLQPRFVDADGLGHISNTAFPVWLEEARRPLFEAFNPGCALETWNLILKKFEIELHQQTSYAFPVTIEGEVTQVGRTSLTVAQRVFQRGRLVGEGRTVLIHFDYTAQKPAPIPEAARAWLTQHLVGDAVDSSDGSSA